MLNEEEIRRFKREGYLIKRGIIDPEYCAQARKRLWDDPPASMVEDDPSTWVGPIKPEEESEDPDNLKRGYRWQYRKVGREEWMAEGLPRHPFIQAVVSQLMGEGRFNRPGVRGIYCTLPYGDVERQPRHMHIDDGTACIGVVCYVDRVEPDGGGFTVWPGSHRRLYYTSTSRYVKKPTPDFDQVVAEYDASWETSSFQTYGDPGDLIFWHHRMAHMASPNYTAQIRKAVLTDFKFNDVERLAKEPPGEDMWEDWTDEVRES